MHYMYVVECADGTWYTGYTTDVLKRISAHNAGRGAKYTKARRPVRLIAQAAFETKHDAMSAEFRFKQLDRRRKELLVGRATDGDSFDKVLRYGLGLAGVLERSETGGGAEQWCEDGKELAMADDGLRIRKGSMEDVDVLTALEAACFPPAEAAGREQFIERLTAFPGHFWLLEKDGEVVAAINGMATDQDAIADEMFADASLHSEEGRWQAIFGVETAPAHRCKGYAALLMERVIADAREQGRRGCILTCKEALLGYYGRFGYQNCGISGSEHGGAVWYDMKIEF